MEKIIQEKFKIKKWEWIPLFGAIAFVFRIERWRITLEDAKLRKGIGKFRSIWNLFFLAIAIIFLILFFTLRNNYGFGAFPWFFWLGLSLGLGNNITVLIPLFLYKMGYKKYLETLSKQEVA